MTNLVLLAMLVDMLGCPISGATAATCRAQWVQVIDVDPKHDPKPVFEIIIHKEK